MPALEGLVKTDPLVAHSFMLEIKDYTVQALTGVSGIEVEVDVVTASVVSGLGKRETYKTLGAQTKTSDLTLTRLAPADSTGDDLWKWFNLVRDKGIKIGDRKAQRKDGSIVIYDTTNTEVSRFNFFGAFLSKIATDALSSDSNEAVKENITMVVERLERIK